MSKTYSFLDVVASLTGPGAVINLGAGAGLAEEGITVDPASDIDTMSIGADGEGMHALHGDKSGTVTVRLLKTSPTNALLMAAYNFQTASSATHGQNTITIVDTVRGDAITARQASFVRRPSLGYGKEAGMVEWVFNAVKIDTGLGA